MGLLETIKAMEIKGLLPPKVTGTRWLPHLYRAINSLLRTYLAYEAHLSTLSRKAKAEGLAKMVVNFGLISFVLCLQVYINNLN
ncbi:MAG: hypothetical protein ABW185_24325 [Sedimenticola sp.]